MTSRTRLDGRLAFWDTPYFQKFVFKTVRKNLWKFGEAYELEDLIQEMYFVFIRVLDRYPEAKEMCHIAALVRTGIANHLVNLNSKQILQEQVPTPSSGPPSLYDLRCPNPRVCHAEELSLTGDLEESGSRGFLSGVESMELLGELAGAPREVYELLKTLLHQPRSAWDFRRTSRESRKLPTRETTESYRLRLGKGAPLGAWDQLRAILKGEEVDDGDHQTIGI